MGRKIDEAAIEKMREFVRGGWRKYGDATPSVELLSRHLGISRPTLWRWAGRAPEDEVHEEFLRLYDEMLAEQVRIVANGALENRMNAVFAKFLLSARHDWREKTESKVEAEIVEPDAETRRKAEEARRAAMD